MEDYVNVNFFWGGQIIRRDDDVRYSLDPRSMRYIKWGTSYEELKDIVFDVMQISRLHWDIKLSCKYPQLGVGNVISAFFVAKICCDDDVRRMLSIPQRMMMGMGDVSMYIETERICTNEPYVYGGEWNSQQSQSTYVPEEAPTNYPQYGTSGWSEYFYGGGSNPEVVHGHEGHEGGSGREAYEGYGGACSSQTLDMYGGGPSDEAFEGYGGAYRQTESSHGRNITTRSSGKELALIHENESEDLGSSTDEDFYLNEDDEEDDSDEEEAEDNEEDVSRNNEVQMNVHVPRVPWFESEAYTPITVTNNPGDMPLLFDPVHAELSIGALFRDKGTLISAVRQYHVISDRDYHVEKSNPKVYKVKCVMPNCPWILRAAKKERHGLFEITKCPEKHTCLINEPKQDHRKISARMIAKLVKPHVIERPDIKIRNVITMVNDTYNHQIGYNKGWRGKQLALEEVYGNWTTTYSELPMFMAAMMHANPGSAVEIDVVRDHNSIERSSVCKRIFWCLKAMKEGWQNARHVISIDGTFLKGKYNGKILVAMGVDSNNHQYPICYALVDEESYENWAWFLRLLRQHVCRGRKGVCIISDRAPGILAAMRDGRNGFEPPFGVHGFCLFHVRSNFSKNHPGQELKQLMWLAGITPQVRKHEAYMNQIGEISPAALQYLHEINPEMWTLCHDTDGARYGQASTNIMEGFNGNIRMACFLPVTAIMEYLFYKTVKIVNTQRNYVEDCMQKGEEFATRTMDMLSTIIKRANAHKVETFSRQRGIFSVLTHRYQYKSVWKGGNKQNVDIQNSTCTCGKWMCHHLPCSHVVAGCNANNRNWRQWIGPYHYNSKLQLLWEPLIYPLAPIEYWNYELPRQWQQYGKLVPDDALRKKKKKRGERGQSVRIRTEMDQSWSSKKCSRCKQEGHTKRSKRCPLLRE